MNRPINFIFWLALVLCGLPGALVGLSGLIIAALGLLADTAQLKLDTNLDRWTVVLVGAGGICLGLVLIAIPIAFCWWWWQSKTH